MKRWLVTAFMMLAAALARENMVGVCQGKFANPITDICWSCLFPPTLNGTPIMAMGQKDIGNLSGFLCTCISPLRIGIKTGFQEPARRVDATRIPCCFVSLKGIKLDPSIRASEGEICLQQGNIKQSNYQVHQYAGLVLYQLGVVLDNPHLETGSSGVAYITEINLTWNDDELTMLLNPETFLFGSPIVQAACVGDCVLSSVGFGGSAFFRCADCQGLVYPFNGHVQAHISHVRASSLLVQHVMAKLHHEFLMWDTSGTDDLRGIYPEPVMDKTQYKYQMLYLIPQTEKINERCCQPYGRTTVIWSAGKSYPYADEDFVYVISCKKNHCLRVGF